MEVNVVAESNVVENICRRDLKLQKEFGVVDKCCREKLVWSMQARVWSSFREMRVNDVVGQVADAKVECSICRRAVG